MYTYENSWHNFVQLFENTTPDLMLIISQNSSSDSFIHSQQMYYFT
jgi:hypothetical protein